jgi:hypothetical protein
MRPASSTATSGLRSRHPVLAVLALTVGIAAAGTGIALVAHTVWAAGQSPSCSWPLRVRGPASPEQAGLVRCYLRALASRDQSAMLAVADTDPPVRITAADFAHGTDARTGTATVTFIPNLSDTASMTVAITFADSMHADLGLINMIEMGGPSVWRLQIGTVTDPSPGPPPIRIGS